MKRRNGDFLGAFTVYGYMKSEDNKNLLVTDPYASRVVRNIFQMRLEGSSALRIANELNRLGILSPLAYKKPRPALRQEGLCRQRRLQMEFGR